MLLEVSFSLSIHSKNTPHLHDGFLVHRNEHNPVYVKSVIAFYCIHEFLNNW